MVIVEQQLVKRVNIRFVATIGLLLAIGLLVQYSASRNVSADSFYYIKKQLVWIGAGLCGTVLAFRFDYRKLRAYTAQAYLLAVASLVLVYFAGHQAGGAQSWLGWGGLQLQPAEFAKIAFILILADRLEAQKGDISQLRQILPILAYAAVPLILIVIQPDLGSALVFAAIVAGMFYVAGVPVKILAWLAGICAAAVPLAYEFLLKPYQRLRLTVFINPWVDKLGAGYNVIQSTIAVGSGRFFGRGYLQGTQAHLNFLPAHHTDFVFSVLAEETGFIGTILVLFIFYKLLKSTLEQLAQSYDRYGMLVVTGLICMWTFHIMENVGMAIGIMPITGIPLPFVSYGGSAMIVNLMAAGLIANVQTRRFVY